MTLPPLFDHRSLDTTPAMLSPSNPALGPFRHTASAWCVKGTPTVTPYFPVSKTTACYFRSQQTFIKSLLCAMHRDPTYMCMCRV